MKNNIFYFLRGIKYFFWNYILCWFPSYHARTFILKVFYRLNIERSACIHIGVKIFGHGRGLKVGANTVINPECRLDGRGGLTIGNNVSVSREVFFLSLTHDYNSPSFDLKYGPIVVGDNSWIGIRALIMPGVKIGKGAVIGAGSVVTHDIPDNAVAAGVPAKVIGKRTTTEFPNVYYRPFLGGET